jgi:hypothetical protein
MAEAMAVKKRVTRLEDLMAQLIRTVERVDLQLDRTDAQMERTQRNLDQLSAEMRDFKEEMLDFKGETRKRWGELSNKMGTMAEDLVAPSIERVLWETAGCAKDEVEYVAVRVKRRHPDTKMRQEFDVIAVCDEYLLVNETKSSLTPDAMKTFVESRLRSIREFFPEYADKQIIGAVASLYVDESLVRYGERLGSIVLGFGEDLMDVLNAPGFVPKVF